MAVKNTWKRTFKFLDKEKKKLDVEFWSTLIWPEIVVHGKLMQAMPKNTMMKTILPFRSLHYFSSNNCWADHRLSLVLKLKWVLFYNVGPCLLWLLRHNFLWFEENLVEWGIWIMVSKEKTLGGVNFNFSVIYSLNSCIQLHI